MPVSTLRTLMLSLCFMGLTPPLLAQETILVSTVTAESRAVTHRMSLTGELVAYESLTIAFPTGGRVAEVMVDEGDRVTKGTPLARIEHVQQEQALRAAQAGMATATASLTRAREDSERQAALFERGATTRSARDTAADTLLAATATAAQAQAELDRTRDALADTQLLAPADATVTARNTEPGQVVGAAQPVLELALGDRFDARFEVPEVALTTGAPKGQIRISPLERPDQIVTGTLRDISPLVNATRGTVEVTVTLDSPIKGLGYGDAVRGTVEQASDARVSLPWSSMTANAAGPAVWVRDRDSGAVHLRPITVLRYASGQVILSGGVDPGEQVVRLGTQFLFDGRVVDVAEETQ